MGCAYPEARYQDIDLPFLRDEALACRKRIPDGFSGDATEDRQEFPASLAHGEHLDLWVAYSSLFKLFQSIYGIVVHHCAKNRTALALSSSQQGDALLQQA